jgi:hypothetical protein
VTRFALPSLQLLGPPTDMPVTRLEQSGVLHRPAPADVALLELRLRRREADDVQEQLTSGRVPGSAAQRRPGWESILAGAFEADVFQDQQGRSFVRGWTSNAPEGPWEMVLTGNGQPQNVATFQRRTADQLAYGARIAPLPGAGWTVVYSVDDPIRQWDDFTLYRGGFKAPIGFPPP